MYNSLKTKGQGTVWLPPKWATTEAARWGPEGHIKNYSHNNLLKETELKAALTGSTRRPKGGPPKKAQRLKKKDAYSRLQACNCWGGWWRWWWGCWWMRTRSANHKSIWQRNGIWSLSLESEGKIVGLDLYCGGGGWFSHITSSCDWKRTVKTTLAKGQHARTRRTARNFLIFSHGSSTPK